MGECLIIRSGGGTDTSGATATAARVLSGYTCYVNDVKITGTMANQGTKNASLNAGGSYTIPAGYHSGSGKVTANALSGQTSATATAARILSGRTAWVNGSKLTGTMTNRGAISQKLAANGSYTVPAGWHNGSGKVTQSLTTQGAKNVTPKTTNQTACAASRWTTGNIVIVGASTLTAGNIKKGVKIFNVTGTFVGIVDSTYVIYQSGSATIHGFSWTSYIDKDRTSRDDPSVSVRSDYIYCYLGHNSYHNVAGICFDTSVVWGRKHVIWAIIKAGTNYNWDRDVVNTRILYGNSLGSVGWSSGFYLDNPNNSSGYDALCVNDGKVTKCGGYFGTDDCRIPVKCSGPGFWSVFSSSDTSYSVWGEIYKIWIQFV